MMLKFETTTAAVSPSPISSDPSASRSTLGSDRALTINPKPFTKHTKLQCPRFAGDDFLGWQMKINQFFEADNTEQEQKVRIAMMHLEGRALEWHQRFMRGKESLKEVTWPVYVKALRSRFCDNEFSDAFSALVALKQTNTVDEYFEEFESLLSLNDIDDDQALSIFLTNLKPEIENRIRLFQPKNYTSCL
ncbi:Retrotransposon gag protein [Corchorus olitorius]|uniref:Retrotransposon gag protein n=1 Tax=Corchorus olitorius TaxID=93759 RepID=A0A1R3GPM5_9ROSI|nr:Retrotransposon gag protein [Corchorus olitorius]